jgi:putative sterol carrier protein
MGFPYTDTAQARQFLFEFIQKLDTVPEIHQGWSKLAMVVGIHLENPKLDFWIDARHSPVQILETTPGQEDASLHLTCDLFHKLYLGQENAVLAFVQRKIRTSGRVQGIIQLTSVMPMAIKAYRAFLQEKKLLA